MYDSSSPIMELVQDQKKPINHNATHIASEQEQEQEQAENIPPKIFSKNLNQTLSTSSSSSSSSSSSFSSLEGRFRPENLDQDQLSDDECRSSSYTGPATQQWPQTQVMERSTENTMNPFPNNLTYKLPSHIFARTTSTAPVEWSTLSNESLFSIHMGNMSFAGDYFKSGELAFPQPPLSPSPFDNNRSNADVNADFDVGRRSDVAAATMPLDTSRNVADSEDKVTNVLSKKEQKAAPSIKEVIQANEAANNNFRKMDRSLSHRSDDFSVKSFAFPILGNVDKSGSLRTGYFGKQGKLSPSETPKISLDTQTDEELKQKKEQTHKAQAEPEKSMHRDNRWFSCFPCCAMSCV